LDNWLLKHSVVKLICEGTHEGCESCIRLGTDNL
jgi:hypothetical protein